MTSEFNPFKKTVEQRANAIANEIQIEARRLLAEAKRRGAFAASEALSKEIQIALNEATKNAMKLKSVAKVQQPVVTIQAGANTYKYGSAYKLDWYQFKVYDPATLTQKQIAAVNSMVRSLGVIDQPLNKFYPFIDVLFAFMNGKINEGNFKKITGIELGLSTWNAHSDHNL